MQALSTENTPLHFTKKSYTGKKRVFDCKTTFIWENATERSVPFSMDENRLLKLALDAGEIMLASGAETHRVQDTMRRILLMGDTDMVTASTLSTMLIVSIHSEKDGSLTLSRSVENREVNFQKIAHVNALSRAFVSGKVTLDEAQEEMEKIYHEPCFSLPVTTIAYGIGAAAITLVFDGTLWDALAAFVSGAVTGIFFALLARWKKPYFLATFLGGILAGVCAMAFYRIFQVDVQANNYNIAIVGCTLPLLPGLTMTNAIRDILEGNFISGTAKLMEALLIAVAVASGIAIALSFF